jgi:hypothetical protein
MTTRSSRLARIAVLDNEISELERRLQRLRRERNALTPLGGLPSELVMIICEYILNPAQPSSIASLLHVCFHLYDTAVSSPHLWTSLHWKQSSNWRNICLPRSKGVPLHVEWEAQGKVLDPREEEYDDEEEEDKDRGGSERDDWILNTFATAATAKIHVKRLLSSHPAVRFIENPAPFMRSLDISGYHSKFIIGNQLLGGSFQHLYKLSLSDIMLGQEDASSFSNWYCPSMRHLFLEYLDTCCASLYHMLRAMPHLQSIEVDGPLGVIDPQPITALDHPDFILPLHLPTLHTLRLDKVYREDMAFILFLVPYPSKHLRITYPLDEDTDDYLDSTVNHRVSSRVRGFWESVSGSPQLPAFKAVFTSRDCPYEIDCTLIAKSHVHGLNWNETDEPSLSWILPCKLITEEPILMPMVTMLEFHRNEDCKGLWLQEQSFEPRIFTGVRHVVIQWASQSSGLCANFVEQDQQELLEYVQERMGEGTPLMSITFEGMDPRPTFTQELIAVGGGDLDVVWK